MKQVNTGWQVAATLFIPTGLYAFKRIKKLTYGIILYALTFISSVIIGTVSVVYWHESEELLLFGVVLIYTIPIFIPMFFIRKWSEQWNKSIQQTKTI